MPSPNGPIAELIRSVTPSASYLDTFWTAAPGPHRRRRSPVVISLQRSRSHVQIGGPDLGSAGVLLADLADRPVQCCRGTGRSWPTGLGHRRIEGIRDPGGMPVGDRPQ